MALRPRQAGSQRHHAGCVACARPRHVRPQAPPPRRGGRQSANRGVTQPPYRSHRVPSCRLWEGPVQFRRVYVVALGAAMVLAMIGVVSVASAADNTLRLDPATARRPSRVPRWPTRVALAHDGSTRRCRAARSSSRPRPCLEHGFKARAGTSGRRKAPSPRLTGRRRPGPRRRRREGATTSEPASELWCARAGRRRCRARGDGSRGQRRLRCCHLATGEASPRMPRGCCRSSRRSAAAPARRASGRRRGRARCSRTPSRRAAQLPARLRDGGRETGVASGSRATGGGLTWILAPHRARRTARLSLATTAM